jgi:hypothetical protein
LSITSIIHALLLSSSSLLAAAMARCD